MNLRWKVSLALGAFALVLARPLAAQQADVIRGRITSASTAGMPIANASVTATSFSGGVNRAARTDNDGRYTITFPGGDGDYFVTVIAIGYVPRRFEVKRTADQDILIGDARLTATGSTLDTVVTTGQRTRPLPNDIIPDISGTERRVNIDLVSADQIGNLASMSASLPGVLFIPGTNGDPSGYAVLGLDALQNGLTLNGMNSVASDLPRDGNYSVSVAISPYDATQGQFSGARQNVTASSGSNYISRTSSLLFNAPQLEWTDRTGRALGQQYRYANLSSGASGPIAFDEAFYSLSFQMRRQANDLYTLLNTDRLGLETEGFSADSLNRLLGVLERAQVPATVRGFPSDRLSDQGLILGRLDFAPPSSSTGQAFNVTFNGGWTRSSPASSLSTALPASSFNTTNWNGTVQGHHMSYFGFGILTETGLAVTQSRRFTTPYLDLPSGNVRISSAFADLGSAVQPLVFGGATTNSSTTSTSVDLTNQLNWFSVNNKHRIKLASEIRRDAYSLDQATNQLGTFTFNSLADLQAGRPASFTRQLTPIRNSSGEIIGGLALVDSYRASPDLQISYGARLDANQFLDRPALNADVERLFGARNSDVPNRLYVSPRIGFSWTYGTAPQIGAFEGAARPPRAIVRGGVGVFQNSPNATLPTQAIATTGLPSGVQQMTCVGAATPAPNWSAYATDPASIPTQCADGTAGTVFASTVPNVTLFARDYAAQRSLRSNLQWSGAVLDNRMLATVGGIYSLNMNQTGFVDLNLDPVARFTLPAENGRPVFVQPASIVPATGAIASRDGRVSSLFNHVTELRSGLSSVSRQVTLQLFPLAPSSRYTWGLGYTLNSVRDGASGFTSTTGNPFDIAGGRSAADWRHQVQFNVGYNFFDAVRVNWVESFFSGFPFTPTIAGDVNGDGYATNDRAFIFDPSRIADTAAASAMRSLVTRSSSRVRDCLQQQLGQLASRSSCMGPWTSSAAMSITFNPVKVRMPQRTMLSFSVGNPLGAADYLLHGQSHPHGWGQAAIPDDRLLFVRGFDPQSRAYSYQVNQRFGNASQSVSAIRSPVTLTAWLRVDVGPSRERQELTRTLDRGRKAPGVKVSAGDLKAAYGSAGLINPLATILRASDPLHLTGKQADSIATMNRWYIVRLDSIWSPVARDYALLPDRYDQGAAYDRYRRAREGSVDLIAKVAPAISALLTAEQRRKLPPIIAAYLDRRYLAAVRSGTSGLSAAVFPPPAGVPGGGGRGRGGGGI